MADSRPQRKPNACGAEMGGFVGGYLHQGMPITELKVARFVSLCCSPRDPPPFSWLASSLGLTEVRTCRTSRNSLGQCPE
ncbi:TPA: hypothetical protein ACH3X2_004689 [Trebouxia sp. C0005]